MKKLLTTLIFILMMSAMTICCSSCGSSPLAKAYDDLTKIAENESKKASSQYSYAVNNPLMLKYNEEKDALTIKLNSTADLDKIFDVLDKDLSDKDIGTIIFLMDGTRGDGFENDLNKKMGQLECKSIAMLGVNFLITEQELQNHDWTKLAKKTEALYVSNVYGLSDVYSYGKNEQNRLANIKHIEIDYDGNEHFSSYTFLKNLESISLVNNDIYDIEEPDTSQPSTGNLGGNSAGNYIGNSAGNYTGNSVGNSTNNSTGSPANNSAGNSAESSSNNSNSSSAINSVNNSVVNSSGSSGNSSSGSSTANSTESKDSDKEAAPEPLDFNYNVYSAIGSDLMNFGKMKNLKTLLIYPDTGYKLTESGEKFIVSLKYILPDLQVNKPGSISPKENTDEDSNQTTNNDEKSSDSDTKTGTVAVKEIYTPSFDQNKQLDVLADLLKPEIHKIYSKCKKFKKKHGNPKINGHVLVYEDQPFENNWSTKRAVSGTGKCLIAETKRAGLKTPETVKDFQTFVLIYPTYTHTGKYTSGTKAYKKTLHVQVFDMARKLAYDPKIIDTAAAPHSFRYYIGSMPAKHSGETKTKKAFIYLRKLPKQ